MTARLPHISPGRAVGVTAMFIGFQFAFTIVAIIVLTVLGGGQLEQLMHQLPLTLGIANSLAALTVITLERSRQRLPWVFLPPARASVAWMLLPTLLAAFGTTAVGGAVSDILNRFLPTLFESSFDMDGLFDLAAHPIAIPITLIIVAPLTEETIFRGLLLAGLLRTRSPRGAILITATLFSAMHLNPAQMPATFLIGLTYGWIYYRTRSLSLCIVAHMLHNTLAMLVTGYSLTLDEATRAAEQAPLPLVFGIGAIALAAGLLLIRRFTPAPPPETPPPLPAPVEIVTQ